nr:MAG TPA: hypothetical protein [Caudoviricetes sp.]
MKMTIACSVMIQRPYLCYVRVDRNASDTQIEEIVKKKDSRRTGICACRG